MNKIVRLLSSFFVDCSVAVLGVFCTLSRFAMEQESLSSPWTLLYDQERHSIRDPAFRLLGVALVIVAIAGGGLGCSAGNLSPAEPGESVVIDGETEIEVVFFWSGACASCTFSEEARKAAEEAELSERARSMLEALSEQYPQLDIVSLEVAYHPENREYLESVAKSFGVDHPRVPMIFIGRRYWTFFGEQSKQEVQTYVETMRDEGVIPNQIPTPRH